MRWGSLLRSCVFTMFRRGAGAAWFPAISPQSRSLWARSTRGFYGSAPCKAACRTRRRARWPQLKVVRGGGAVPLRSADASLVARHTARCSAMGSAASAVAPMTGSIKAPAQRAAHSQRSAQQSISSCPPAICEELAIGHSGDGVANAGPDVTARVRASQSRVSRRHISIWITEAPVRNNVLQSSQEDDGQNAKVSRRALLVIPVLLLGVALAPEMQLLAMNRAPLQKVLGIDPAGGFVLALKLPEGRSRSTSPKQASG